MTQDQIVQQALMILDARMRAAPTLVVARGGAGLPEVVAA